MFLPNFFLFYSDNAEEKCFDTYNLIGCFEENNPGKLLENYRNDINWHNIFAFMIE